MQLAAMIKEVNQSKYITPVLSGCDTNDKSSTSTSLALVAGVMAIIRMKL